MEWAIDFISEEHFRRHVADTINKYGEKLQPFDIQRFNKNIVDPVKLIFDKTVYRTSWEQIIGNEIFRQRDKSNNNDIGYFHQRIFNFIDNCSVPDHGWDVIYENEDGIRLPDGDVVNTIYVEMKNKHNTMNSASAGKTYIKMQHQLLEDDNCACFLVEAIAQHSQNIKWETTVDGKKVSHRRIRRVSLDQFYGLVTGDEDAFYKMCLVLPATISNVVESAGEALVPSDTVVVELRRIANLIDMDSEELSMAMAIYLLGFSSYKGFGGYFLENLEGGEGYVGEQIKLLYDFARNKR